MTTMDDDEKAIAAAQAAQLQALIATGVAVLPVHLRSETSEAIVAACAAMLNSTALQLIEYMHESFAPSAKRDREWAERMRRGR